MHWQALSLATTRLCCSERDQLNETTTNMPNLYPIRRSGAARIAFAVIVALCSFALSLASRAQTPLPFKVYSGTVGHYEITKGVNTIKINDGFLTTGTVPVAANGVYRIKPGQALALLYQVRNANASTQRVDFGKLPTEQFGKVIRRVDGQEVRMENYLGASTRFELTWVNKAADDAYTISRKFKSKFNPPLPSADFDRTDGVFLINSTDPYEALKSPAFAKDVNKVAGKVLTVYYLVSAIDAAPFFTVEVDFTDVKPGSPSSPKKTGSPEQAGALDAEKIRQDRAQSQQHAADDRAGAKKQKDDDRAAAKAAQVEARAEAAAERARVRAEAATLRKVLP